MNNLFKKGFIGIIALIVIAIILLSYLGFDLKKIFTSPSVINNFSYVWGIIKTIWLNYLSVPFTFVWNQVVVPLMQILWKVFLAGVDNIKNSNLTK